MEKRKIWHRIASCNRSFTRDEWNKYLQESNQNPDKRIVTTIGKYKWNDCDICLNPEEWMISVKSGSYGYYVIITWADCGNGVWAFGLKYNTGTGGGCFGVSYATGKEKQIWNRGFESELSCKKYALRYAMTRLHPYNDNGVMINRLKDAIQAELNKLSRPQYVQLSLFD